MVLAALVVAAVAAVSAVSAASAAGAVGAALPGQAGSCVVRAASSPVAPTGTVGNGAPGPWPSKVLVKHTVVQVMDPTTATAYGLVSETRDSEGPDRLLAIPLGGGAARQGPTFGLAGGAVDTLALADGSLWVTSSTGADDRLGPQLCQVEPRTLHLVRRLRLPAPRPAEAAGLSALVSAGPGDTVWVGYGGTLVHVEVRDGTVLATESVPSGTIVSLATDPARRTLYVSVSYPTIDGQKVDAAVEAAPRGAGRSSPRPRRPAR